MKLKIQKTIKNALIFSTFLSINNFFAQTYNSTDYANQGDTVYVSKATLNTLNYDTTGVGIIWDYSTLVGNSQNREVFANPTQTGYSVGQFPYIFNSNNVNLAQTNGQTLAVGTLSTTDPYNYFKKTTNFLQQSASAYKIVVGSTSINIKNTYNTPDILYKFPLNFGDIDSSNANYSTNIPNVYFRNTELKRVNRVIGSGTVITPHGTFANALKLESTVNQIDSFSINGVGYPTTTIVYKELKWLDPSKKYPLLIVRKDQINSVFVTSSIEYLADKIYYQPTALFAYYPVCPIIGDTIQFQNLSLNSEVFSWNFDDASSGGLNTSLLQNPSHIYTGEGTFNVQLISNNGNLADTVIIPVFINENLDSPTITISASQNSVCSGDTIFFSSVITNGGSFPTYQWKLNGNNIFGADSSSFYSSSLSEGDSITCQLISSNVCLNSIIDTSNVFVVSINEATSGSETIVACNSYFWNANNQTYTTTGVYFATLENAATCDSIVTLNLTINLENAPLPVISASGDLEFCEGDDVTLISDITAGITWSTGETTPSILVSSSESIFVSYIQNTCLVSSAVTEVIVNANPTPTLSAIPDICDTSSIFTLNQGLPSGGIYTLNNTTITSFDPSNASLGQNEITYTVTDGNSCSGSVSTSFDVLDCTNVTGLTEIKKLISVFPNPASTIIKVNCPKGFQIYNSLGSLIIETKQATTTIFIGDLPQGLYILKTDSNVERFIKQ